MPLLILVLYFIFMLFSISGFRLFVFNRSIFEIAYLGFAFSFIKFTGFSEVTFQLFIFKMNSAAWLVRLCDSVPFFNKYLYIQLTFI
jgi:hypothetical protein